MLDHALTWRTLHVDGVTVTDVDGRNSDDGKVFVVAQGFHACADAFEMQRFALMARRLEARLVVVDTPGFGCAPTRLGRAERRALLRGDFRPLAARMLAAARTVAGEESGIIGYSMGTSVGTAMAAVAQNPLEALVLFEPVALRPWTMPGLYAATRFEDRHMPGYLAETRAVEGAVERPGDPANRRVDDLALLANALRKQRLVPDALDAAARLRRVVIVQGDDSYLSKRKDLPKLTRALETARVPAHVVRTPGHHSFWQSLPRMARIIDQVAGLLRTARPSGAPAPR
ncbi:alpha/beta fold hydrolase [Actinomadura parmotrematis]|uniref:Alpha/beta hydrolase n=1 Tax=Actinomadura parmotrematis TaxID=2864039 RepID=A0ABS7FMF1_9ACTN|nr:alpha/beta hydrolase [Actinomadura parmotrematis]MBW8481405.1 alpha/beta hydrolase [Actinomadura parmotrematis]